MKATKFNSYDEYISTQRRTILRRRHRHAFFTWMEVKVACDWMKSKWDGWESRQIKGVCHGARNGLESDEFLKNFPGSSVIGTDLFPFCGNSGEWRGATEVVQCDFAIQKPEWIGSFDFVYSNSLDHAQDAEACLKTWLDQLRPDGFLVLQWHDCFDTHSGDCFVCTSEELVAMLGKVGEFKEKIHSKCPYQRRNPISARALVVDLLISGKKPACPILSS